MVKFTARVLRDKDKPSAHIETSQSEGSKTEPAETAHPLLPQHPDHFLRDKKQKQQRAHQQDPHSRRAKPILYLPAGQDGAGLPDGKLALRHSDAAATSGERIPSHHAGQLRDDGTRDDRPRHPFPQPSNPYGRKPRARGGDRGEDGRQQPIVGHQKPTAGNAASPETDEQILYRYGAHRP